MRWQALLWELNRRMMEAPRGSSEDRPSATMPASAAATPASSSTGFPVRVALVASLAAINNLAFGYDVGVVSGSLRDMATSLSLSTIEQEAATSGLNFVAGAGALLMSGNLLDLLGRKATLLAASVLLLVGAAVVSLAQNFPVLLLGRALQGLGSGCGWCACSVYITEIAPPAYRGSLVAISDIAINVGILLGYAVDRMINVWIDTPDARWRVAMAISATMPLIYVLLFSCVPETPRWLVMAGREDDAARALAWMGGATGGTAETTPCLPRRRSDGGDDPGAAAVAGDIAAIAASVRGARTVSWRGIFSRRQVSTSLLVTVIVLGLGQQLTGTEAILYYTPRIVNECVGGETEGCVSAQTVFLISIGVGACKLVGELVAACLVESVGRRRTLAVSNLLVSATIFTIALKFALGWPTAAGAASLCLTMLFFSLGPGPLTFVVVNEIVPLPARGKLVALSVFFNRLGSGTIALTFLTLKNRVGTFASFTLYALLGVALTVFYWLGVPDVTGKSLEEADAPASPAAAAAARGEAQDRSMLANDAAAATSYGTATRDDGAAL